MTAVLAFMTFMYKITAFTTFKIPKPSTIVPVLPSFISSLESLLSSVSVQCPYSKFREPLCGGAIPGLFLALHSKIATRKLGGPYGMPETEAGLAVCRANKLPTVLSLQSKPLSCADKELVPTVGLIPPFPSSFTGYCCQISYPYLVQPPNAALHSILWAHWLGISQLPFSSLLLFLSLLSALSFLSLSLLFSILSLFLLRLKSPGKGGGTMGGK